MSATDYRALYEEYWSRPDRWGSHSFADADGLARQVLNVCGPGSILDVGCGMGLLVRTLSAMGAPATGCDVAPSCVDAGNRAAPGRFVEGSILDLPFADGSFDTVVSTDTLEHLAPEDCDRALVEMARVARRAVFARVATAPDRDKRWHLTVKPREWWEERFIRAGLRKHPAAHRAIPYDAIEREGPHATIVAEKIPAEALARHSLDSLRAGRDLHMDMLREAGRRSDAHIARYAHAAAFVRPGDTVLDVACGLGYGSAVLARSTLAARVIGVDSDAAAVGYAAACYAGGAVEFRHGTLPDLSFLPDRSVDLIASFETLEHVPDPGATLREFERVLTPGGRIVVSVPNDWTDETGKDPNPHHFHVYTWDRLAAEISERFLLEVATAQTAGGGMKLSDRPRALVNAPFAAERPDDPVLPTALASAPEAEWWLAVAMKSPLGATREGYRETAFGEGAQADGYHLTAFARDYDNPWLVRSMVSIGMRATRPALLRRLARATLASARPGSADEGAALCVLAYDLLERVASGAGDADAARDLVQRIDAFHARADDTPHAWRWRISNAYAAGRLLSALGDTAGARAAFEACADMDCLRFSPLLASKTVDAAFRLGWLAAQAGEPERARAWWTRGVAECRRVLTGDWLNIVRDPARPVAFGLPEVATVADLASRCSYALCALERRTDDPALLWSHSNSLTHADTLRWAQSLVKAKEWLEGQVAARDARVAGLTVELRESRAESERLRDRTSVMRVLDHLHAWVAQLQEATDWLSQQRAQLTESLAERERTIADLRDWNARLEEAKQWHSDQRERLAGTVEERDKAIETLREAVATLDQAKAWHSDQRERLARTVEERDKTIQELRAWSAKLEEAKDWFSAQHDTLAKTVSERDKTIEELRAWSAKLEEAKDWFSGQHDTLAKTVGERDKTIQELRAWAEELTAGRAWFEENARSWERVAADHQREAQEQRGRADDLERRGADGRAALEARVSALESEGARLRDEVALLRARNDALDRRLAARVREAPPAPPAAPLSSGPAPVAENGATGAPGPSAPGSGTKPAGDGGSTELASPAPR